MKNVSILIVCIVIALFILIPMGVDPGIGALISIALGVFIFLGFLNAKAIKNSKEAAKIKNATKDSLDCKISAGIVFLTLKKRINANKMALEFRGMTDYNLKYHEAGYVYTGATVGGVTTGGVHKTGDYHTVEGSSTGKFEVCYVYYDPVSKTNNKELRPICKIKLSDELVEEAKKDSFISSFLEENALVLEKKTNKYDEGLKSAMDAGDTALAMQIAKAIYFEKQLTKSECLYVIDWMSGLK